MILSKRMKEKEIFWIPTKEAEIGRSRPLTNQEKKYIQHSNWIRLMKLFGYLSILVVGIVGIFVLLISITYLFDLEGYPFFANVLIRIAPAFILTSLFVFALRKKIPWRVSFWLSLKKLEAVELTGLFGLEINDIVSPIKVYRLSKTHFLMPEHWEKYIPSLYPEKGKLPTITIWAVKRKDATNKIYTYISTYFINNSFSNKLLSRFQDYTYYALTCGSLGVDEDLKQRLPFFRANSFWMGLIILFGLVGVFSLPIFSNQLTRNNRAVTSIESSIDRIENKLNLGDGIDSTVFSLRGIPPFTADVNYGNRVLVNKSSFEYYDVSISQNSQSFLLMPPEYKMIMRVSLVTPRVSLGSNKPSTKTLNNYRNEIKAVINKSTDLPERIRSNTLATLASVSDIVLEQQIRSSNSFKVDLDYAKQFLPTPFIYMPPNNNNSSRTCNNRRLFCILTDEKQVMSSENMAIVHAENTTDNSSTGFQIIYAHNLATLKEYRQQREALNYKDPIIYWALDIGVIGILALLISVSIAISYFQANRQISKHYKKKLKM